MINLLITARPAVALHSLILEDQTFHLIFFMNNQGDDARSREMSTLTELMAHAAQMGYTASFEPLINDEGALLLSNGHDSFPPAAIHIPNYYRFEGISDPDDMAILYLIEAADGSKGTLVDAYGTYSDTRVSDFVRAVQDIHKAEAE